MHKQDLALNSIQWLICHKIEPNQTTFSEVQFAYFTSPANTVIHFRGILSCFKN